MWFQSVNVLDLSFKGILVGVIASGLMGPVGVLCIQRTLNKGRWYGFVTGIGAAISDIIYALITGFGMSFVMDFITNERNLFYLKLIGSFMLLLFGIYSYRSNPAKNYHPVSRNKGTLVHNGVTAFLVTFSNPLIIFLFMALFAQFAFVVPNHPFEQCLGFLSIFVGALLWWLGLTYLINKVRNRFDSRGLLLINKVIGIIVILASVVVFIGTVTNLYSLEY
jgi:threonine/homoserine/homoserine lactone efflux protein